MNRFFLLFFLLVLSCDNDSEIGSYKVYGKVYYNSEPTSKVTVTIDEFDNQSTETSEDGSFVIDNISSGEHIIVIKRQIEKDGVTSSTEKSYHLNVNGDVELDNLRLPQAVFLSNVMATESSVSMVWSQTDDPEFREYKIYRHTTSGLDETTGLLAHVSTSYSDTSFVDKDIFPNQKFFYRVYVMDNFGKIGGSNIIEANATSKELVVDGSFESLSWPDSLQNEWWFNGCPWNSWSVNSEESTQGDQSLQITSTGKNGFWCGAIISNKVPISRGDVTPGQKLQLTFQYKGATNDMRLMLGGIMGGEYIHGLIGSNSEWKTYSRDVYVPEELTVWNLEFVIQIDPGSLVGTTVLVDNMSLKASD